MDDAEDVYAAFESAAGDVAPDEEATSEQGAALLEGLSAAGLQAFRQGVELTEPEVAAELLRAYLEIAGAGRDGLIGVRNAGFVVSRR